MNPVSIIFGNIHTTAHIIVKLSRQQRCTALRVSKMWQKCIMDIVISIPESEIEFYNACYEGDIIYLSMHMWPIQWLVRGFEEAYKGHQEIVVRRFLQLMREPREDGIPVRYRSCLSKWCKYVGVYDTDDFNMINEMKSILYKCILVISEYDVKNIIIRDALSEFKAYLAKNLPYKNLTTMPIRCAIKHRSFKIAKHLIENSGAYLPREYISNMTSSERIELLAGLMRETIDMNNSSWRWLCTLVLSENYDKMINYLSNNMSEEKYDILDKEIMTQVRIRYHEINKLIEPYQLLSISKTFKYMAAGGEFNIEMYIKLYDSEIEYSDVLTNAIKYGIDVETILYALEVTISHEIPSEYFIYDLSDITMKPYLSYSDMRKILTTYVDYIVDKEDELQQLAMHILWIICETKYRQVHGSLDEYQVFIDYCISYVIKYDNDYIWEEDTREAIECGANNINVLKLLEQLPLNHEHLEDQMHGLLSQACNKNNYQLMLFIKNRVNDNIKCGNCMGSIADHFHNVRL